MRPILIRLMPRQWRQQRTEQLLLQLQSWELEGRDLLAQLIELTDQGDDLHVECRRVLELLEP